MDGDTVGHILFSRMWVDTPAGLDEMRRLGERVVIVVGHPAYYPRFGFEPAGAYGPTSPFPDEAFMVMELVPEALRGMAGPVRYPAAFGI